MTAFALAARSQSCLHGRSVAGRARAQPARRSRIVPHASAGDEETGLILSGRSGGITPGNSSGPDKFLLDSGVKTTRTVSKDGEVSVTIKVPVRSAWLVRWRDCSVPRALTIFQRDDGVCAR